MPDITDVMDRLAEEMGWTPTTELLLAVRFIEKKNLRREFKKYLEKQAKTEKEMTR